MKNAFTNIITTCFNKEIEDGKQFGTHGHFILVNKQNPKVVTAVDTIFPSQEKKHT